MNQLKGDNDQIDSSSTKLSDIQKLYEFKNERPSHVLGSERDDYEALCRGESIKVSKF